MLTCMSSCSENYLRIINMYHVICDFQLGYKTDAKMWAFVYTLARKA